MKRTPARSDEIKVEYHGINVAYNERTNKWTFDVRGREREVDSLEQAKLIIDKPEPKEKPPFDKFEAWYEGRYRGEGYHKVTVTSIGIEKWGDPYQVWIVDNNSKTPQREKVSAGSIFPCNERNNAMVDALIRLDNEIEKLNQEVEKTKKYLKCFQIPALKGTKE